MLFRSPQLGNARVTAAVAMASTRLLLGWSAAASRRWPPARDAVPPDVRAGSLLRRVASAGFPARARPWRRRRVGSAVPWHRPWRLRGHQAAPGVRPSRGQNGATGSGRPMASGLNRIRVGAFRSGISWGCFRAWRRPAARRWGLQLLVLAAPPRAAAGVAAAPMLSAWASGAPGTWRRPGAGPPGIRRRWRPAGVPVDGAERPCGRP